MTSRVVVYDIPNTHFKHAEMHSYCQVQVRYYTFRKALQLIIRSIYVFIFQHFINKKVLKLIERFLGS